MIQEHTFFGSSDSYFPPAPVPTSLRAPHPAACATLFQRSPVRKPTMHGWVKQAHADSEASPTQTTRNSAQKDMCNKARGEERTQTLCDTGSPSSSSGTYGKNTKKHACTVSAQRQRQRGGRPRCIHLDCHARRPDGEN